MESTHIAENINTTHTDLVWLGPGGQVCQDGKDNSQLLREFSQPLWVVESNGKVCLAVGGEVSSRHGQQADWNLLGAIPAISLEYLGDAGFQKAYGTKYSYYAGAMANGIASERLVIALGKAGYLGSFGAAGLGPERIQSAIDEIKTALPDGPYAFNLINSPSAPDAEASSAELFVKNGVTTVECGYDGSAGVLPRFWSGKEPRWFCAHQSPDDRQALPARSCDLVFIACSAGYSETFVG